MLKKEASRITGGLSAPGKMPEGSYNLPASACQTGAKLREIEGTPCHKCYAFKGRYNFPDVKAALQRRLKSLDHPQWVEAMTTLVKKKKHFRWHDSGDIQSVQHLIKIFEVCANTPGTMHWLPTQERRYLPINWRHPKNLVIRLSNAKNNSKPGNAWSHWSTVVDEGGDCPASKQGNICGSCRRCWDPEVKHVTYPKH
jgi:predicted DNA-binding protein (MmcQ/YjbR family)